MQRVSRFMLILLATIACAILFCIAAFSVSFALWSEDGGLTAEISGESGLFYVNYPKYASEAGVAAPDLDENTYYLQVQKDGGMSDYYAMSNDSDERVLANLYLRVSDKVSLFNGVTKVETFTRDMYSDSNFTLSGNNMSFGADGYYSFYYKSDGSMYVGYSATFTPTDTSEYTYTFKFQFSNKTTESTLHIKSSYKPYIYIWEDSAWYYSTSGYITTDGTTDGSGSSSGGSPRVIDDADGKTISVGTYDGTMVIFNSVEGWNVNQSQNRNLSALAPDTDNYLTLQTGNQNELAKDAIFTAPASPTCDGATSFGSAANELRDDEVVREVDVTETVGKTYHNYVCVSRTVTTGENVASIAYVNFSIDSTSDAVISSFEVTRMITDANGVPKSGPIAMTVYNDPSGKAIKEMDESNLATNPYVTLDFDAGSEQYYAMDVTIIISKAAAFKFTAKASNTDGHTYQVANSFYLGFGDFAMREPIFMGEMAEGFTLPTEGNKIQEYRGELIVETTLVAGDSFKLFASSADGQNKDKYFGVGYHDGDVYYPGISLFKADGSVIVSSTKDNGDKKVLADYAGTDIEKYFAIPTETVGGGSDFDVVKGGKYRLRYYGDVRYAGGGGGVSDYTFSNIDITVLDPITTDNTYTVTFDANGGKWADGSGKKARAVVKGGKVTAPTGVTYEGKALDAWYEDEAFTKKFDFTKAVEGNTTLYAKWIDLFTVTFDRNGGEWVTNAPENNKITAGTDKRIPSDLIPTAQLAGKSLIGWLIDGTETIITQAELATHEFDKDTTLIAQWGEIRYTVTFDLNDETGTTTSQSIGDNGKVTNPGNPTRTDWTFTGWYKDVSDYTSKYDFDSEVTSDFTLYARWMPINTPTSSYYVVGDYPGWGASVDGYIGSATETPFKGAFVKITFGDGQRYFRIVATKNNSTEMDWNNSDANFGYQVITNDTDTNLYDTTQNAQNNISIKEAGTYIIEFTDSYEIRISKYKIGSVTVTFDANGGECDTTSDKTDKDTGKLASLPTPTYSKHNFDGWFTAAEGGTEVTTETVFENDTTVYAHWTQQHTVSFDLNGGNDTGDDFNAQTILHGNKATEPTNPPTKTDMRFVGWYNGDTEWNFDDEVTYDMTLDAHWEVMYTITFDAGAGTLVDATRYTDKDGKLLNVDTTVATELPTPTRNNYIFDGWYDSEEQKVTSTTFSGSITLTAQWRTYIIYFKNADGSNAGTLNAYANGRLGSQQLPEATSPGENFTFVGWRLGNETGMTENGEIITGTYQFTDDTYVWADWVDNTVEKFTVTYQYGDISSIEVEVDEGTIASAPATTIAGHSITGWYTLSGSTETTFTFGTTEITDDTTIYARLTGVAYSINGTLKEFDTPSGTHGGNSEDKATSYLDARDKGYGELVIKVYYDGKALTDMEEENQRVKHDGDTYTIANASADSCYGTFKIEAHRYQKSGSWGSYANIAFYGGVGESEIATESTAAGWYVVGQFSDWKRYSVNKMTGAGAEYFYSATLKYVVSGELCKIVYYSSGAATWYGSGGSTSADASEIIIDVDAKTFYVDEVIIKTNELNSAYHRDPFVSKNDVYRIIFDASALSNWGNVDKDNSMKVCVNNEYTLMYRIGTTLSYYYDVPKSFVSNLIDGVHLQFRDGSTWCTSTEIKNEWMTSIGGFELGYAVTIAYKQGWPTWDWDPVSKTAI